MQIAAPGDEDLAALFISRLISVSKLHFLALSVKNMVSVALDSARILACPWSHEEAKR